MTTQIVNDRETGLKLGYEATDWTKPIAFEVYAEAVKDWIIRTIERDGEPIGAVYQKDDEVHLSIKPQWRAKWLTKSLKKELFETKKVTTRVTPGHEFVIPILTRLGFKDDGTGLFTKENCYGN